MKTKIKGFVGVVVFIFLVGVVVWIAASRQRMSQHRTAVEVTTLEKVVPNVARSNVVPPHSMDTSSDESLSCVRLLPVALGGGALRQLEEQPEAVASAADRGAAAQTASELNQTMDALLNRTGIPSDYGMRMVALVRDAVQDELTRDFAVQHLGLYAQSLARRGTYDPTGREAATLRNVLSEAARETRSIVAAAAFRALADLAAIDAHVDVCDLRCRLMACAGDGGASAAARIMAVQICGERGIRAAIPTLRGIIGDASAGMPLRMSAEVALHRLETQESHVMPFYSREGL